MSKLCRCGNIVDDVCSKCEQAQRGTTTERGYGHDWARVSQWYRARQPVCEYCLYLYDQFGRLPVEPASEVHHIVKIKYAPQLRCEYSNLLAVCEGCHKYLEDNMRTAMQCKNWRMNARHNGKEWR